MLYRHTPKQFISYRRVSTDRQGQHGIGLDVQKVAIDAFAHAHRAVIVEDYYDVSSAMDDHLDRNAGLRKALKHACRAKIPLLVDRLDRLSRDTATVERICKQFDIVIVSTREGGLLLDPATLKSAAARAEEEGRLIRERTREALRQRKASGVQLGNTKNLDVAQRLGAQANKSRSEAKAREIADAIETAGLLDSKVPKIVDALNDLGITSGRGRPWTVSAVRRPLARAREIIEERSRATLEAQADFGRF